MQRLVVARPSVRSQVFPVYSISCYRAERQPTIPRFVAVNDITPTLVHWRIQQWKVRPAAGGIVAGIDIGKEAGHPVAPVDGKGVGRVGEPVGVKVVLLLGRILYELQGLEVG